ncbi:MAG: hypothetical protein HF967_08680 [Methanosarcinales archaeon]|nr:hypothetical protein [Methanosarcinales archaeon]
MSKAEVNENNPLSVWKNLKENEGLRWVDISIRTKIPVPTLYQILSRKNEEELLESIGAKNYLIIKSILGIDLLKEFKKTLIN